MIKNKVYTRSTRNGICVTDTTSVTESTATAGQYNVLSCIPIKDYQYKDKVS